MSKTNVEDLAAKVSAMTPAARLRLAAELLERGKVDLGAAIVERVSAELGAVRLLRRTT
jgi:hypothetical protein